MESVEIVESRQESVADSEESLYAELKRLVEAEGLLNKQPLYYTFTIALTFGLLAFGWVALILIDSFWLRMLDAVFVAFMTVQVGFIGHDAGHQQIFRTSWKNNVLGLLNGFSLGASFAWWVDTHNRHHGRPNQASYDPAINYSIIAFTEEQARKTTGLTRFMVKHQSLFFVPLLMLYPLSMRAQSFRYLLRERCRFRAIEFLSLLSYFPLYFLFLFLIMGFWQALLFAVIHQALFGLYISSVFVPNHMGMPILKAEDDWSFIRQQVLTARNVKGRRVIEFLFGGLNYQIEHHLFPRISRNRLGQTKKIVEQFLREKSISYHETGLFRSFYEIFADLRRVSSPL
jgi:fatty acid desaturase